MGKRSKRQKAGRTNFLKRSRPDTHIELKDLKFPLQTPYVIVKNVFDQAQFSIEDLRKKYEGNDKWSTYIMQKKDEPVDKKRKYRKVDQKEITALQPFLMKLNKAKEATHDIGGLALIRSLPGCVKQASHTDYFTVKSNGKSVGVTMPYSCLIALEEATSVYIKEVKHDIPPACAVILRGDVVHSGSEYKKDNIRFHLYMDVEAKHEAKKGNLLHWK